MIFSLLLDTMILELSHFVMLKTSDDTVASPRSPMDKTKAVFYLHLREKNERKGYATHAESGRSPFFVNGFRPRHEVKT